MSRGSNVTGARGGQLITRCYLFDLLVPMLFYAVIVIVL